MTGGWVPGQSKFTAEWGELCRWLNSIRREEHATCRITVEDTFIYFEHECGLPTVPYPMTGGENHD